jgi:hypothetical protein
MELRILNPQPRFPRAHLVDPPPFGYIHLAGVVGPLAGRTPFPRSSPRKTALLERLKSLARQVESLGAVHRVTVYKAVVVPPPAGYAKQAGVHVARYDVAVLIETTSPETVGEVETSEPYKALSETLGDAASDLHVMTARCARSLGDVDKTRPGLYLFNYFVAEDTPELWEWLAGWYTVETGLHNSTVLQPLEPADYAFVNHARWDYSLPRFMVRQLAKPSFRGYVLSNLLANRTGSMPVLYHLA